MTDDAQLLRRYATEHSQEAFAEFVRRHIGWVYQAGLRRTGGRHDLAQEIAQYVFTSVARDAAALSRRDVPAGWIYVTIRYAASRALRTEARQRQYETAAHAMSESGQIPETAGWNELRPALDTVMDRLPATERETLLLRFFEGKNFREIGTALNLTEDGARMRVSRALEKLRTHLARRGVTSTSAALGTLLTAKVNASVAADVQATITATALSGASVPGATMLGLVQFMSATKITFGTAGLIAGLLCLSTAGVAVYQTTQAHATETALAAASRDYADAQSRLAALNREPRVATPTPSATPATNAAIVQTPSADTTVAQRRADGQAFLNAFDGAIRQQDREQSRREVERNYALFFRAANLSDDKRHALVDRTVQLWEETLEVTPSSIHPGVSQLSRETLRSILGPEDFQLWRDFTVRGEVAVDWAMELAHAVNAGTEPLAMDQLMTLQSLVRENSAEYRAGKKINERTADWDAVTQAARGVLTEAQWQAAQPHLLLRDAVHALERIDDTEKKNSTTP